MLVQTMLNAKPNNAVITIGPDASVVQATAILSEKRIGAIIVSADGTTPDGILSERDIVRELGRRGAACLDDKVRDLMTSSLVTCSPSSTVDKIMADMTDGRFRHMPVLVDGAMVGLISIGDVVKARIDDLAHEKDALQDMIMGR